MKPKNLFHSRPICFHLKEYDPELFGKALPCLTAIGCALPPDYALATTMEDEWYKAAPADANGPYDPQPISTIKYNFSTIYL